MKISRVAFGMLAIILSSYACNQEGSNVEYKVVYKTGGNGEALYGSKLQLIEYFRAGAAMKVGWNEIVEDSHSLEHIVEPIWTAVYNDSIVRVQLPPKYVSTVDWDNLTSTFADSSKVNHEYRVYCNADGEFEEAWYDKHNGTLINFKKQKYPVTWYTKGTIKSTKPYYNAN